MNKYILVDRVPQLCGDVIEWAKWFEKADRRVAYDRVGDSEISTVFLGLDHSFSQREHVPVLFETMVFGGHFSDEQERYCTWSEAEEGHKVWVEKVKLACAAE